MSKGFALSTLSNILNLSFVHFLKADQRVHSRIVASFFHNSFIYFTIVCIYCLCYI